MKERLKEAKSKASIKELREKLNTTQDNLSELEKQNSMASIEEQAAKKQVLSEQLNSFEINKIEKINEIRDYMMKKWFLPYLTLLTRLMMMQKELRTTHSK